MQVKKFQVIQRVHASYSLWVGTVAVAGSPGLDEAKTAARGEVNNGWARVGGVSCNLFGLVD